MYADGMTMLEIQKELKINTATLYKWKKDTWIEEKQMDAWDLARKQRTGNIQRLRFLFERQLDFLESIVPEKINSGHIDALSKLGSLVERWDQIEQAILKALKKVAAENPDIPDAKQKMVEAVDEILGIKIV